MMDRVWVLLVGVLLLGIAPTSGHGANKRANSTVTLAAGMVPHVNSWVTLRITLPRAAGGITRVDMQDARGGVVIRRQLPIFRRHILLPMPYVAGAGGLGGQWPVVMRIRQAGEMLRVQHLQVDLPLGRSIPTTTIAVRNHRELDVSVVARALGTPLLPIIFSRRQLASSPVLNFAECRWLLLDRAVAQLLSPQRLMAMLSLGVRLVCIRSRPPNILPISAWHNSGTSTSGETVWTTRYFNGFKYGAPVVAPHLSRLRLTPLPAPAAWQYVAWAIGPLTIIMLILLRGAGLRRWQFIVSAGLGVALLSTAAIFWLTATTGVITIRYKWHTFFAPGPLSLYNTVTIARSSHPTGQVVAGTPDLTVPLAWSPRAWFAFRGCIKLHRNTAALAYPVARQPTILAYQPQAAVGRDLPRYSPTAACFPAALLPVGFSSKAGVMFMGGRIYFPIQPHHGHDFYNWLKRGNPAAQPVLNLWLLLQFNAHEHYYLSIRRGVQIIALPPTISRINSLPTREFTKRQLKIRSAGHYRKGAER
ncbi:MAG: hypothetical protein ACP5I8_12750 [Phycisphaerae bacterium]